MSDEERGLVKAEAPEIDLEPYIIQFGGKVTVLLPVEHARTWSPLHAASINVVKFSTGQAHKIEGKYMHSKPQLDTMATYAGIKVVDSRVIPEDDPYVFTHQVTMKLLLATGGSVEQTKTKTYDLRDGGSRAERSKQRLMGRIGDALTGKKYGDKTAGYPKYFQPKKAKESDEEFWARAETFVAESVQEELEQARVYGRELAESGAMNRCLRSLLGLKMTWDKEEFEQPVIIVTARIDYQKVFEQIGEKALAQRVMASAFGAMNGADSGEMASLMAAVGDVGPEDVIEAQVVEIQPEDEDFEPVPADVQETLDEMATDEMGAVLQEEKEAPRPVTVDERAALIGYLKQEGYPPGKPQANLLISLFGDGCDLGTINVLQAKVTCQYARDAHAEERANAERTEDKLNNKALKSVKDGIKVLARQAYKAGMDLDAYLKFMQGKPL